MQPASTTTMPPPARLQAPMLGATIAKAELGEQMPRRIQPTAHDRMETRTGLRNQ
jgi:hypothetical protein